MIKIFFMGACLLALGSTPVMAQTKAPEVVVVRVNDGGLGGRLVIIREGGKTEEFEFPNGLNAKALSLSGILMQQVFSKLFAEGYSLKSTFGGSQGYASTLIFVKSQ